MISCCAQIDELRKAHGQDAKMEILMQNRTDEDFRRFLYYLLNPSFTYYLSEEMLRLKDGEAYDEKTPLVFFETPFECCEFLNKLRDIDEATIRQVKLLIYGHCHDELERALLIGLFTQTLHIGVSIKMVNQAIPILIPPWRVQYALTIESCPVKPGTPFWLTPIVKGRRATFYRGRMIAGNGMPYTGTAQIENMLRDFCEENAAVLDGVFTNGCFRVFDIIPLTDFEASEPKTPFSVRRMVLDRIASGLGKEPTMVSVVPLLYYGSDQHVIDTMLKQVTDKGGSGLMLNLDTPYYRKSHSGFLSIYP